MKSKMKSKKGLRKERGIRSRKIEEAKVRWSGVQVEAIKVKWESAKDK